MKKIVVLSGAGVSAESGLKTFRDADGLWEGHDVMEVATPEGFAKNPALVLDFYNQRRRQLSEAKPNIAHKALADLEQDFEVIVVTQNVDDLHERAGSSRVIHLHGELLKSRSVADEFTFYDCQGDILLGDKAPDGHQLRPHIVWFGEAVPEIENAVAEVSKADAVIVVGTSLQVYPASGLMEYAQAETPIFFIDPRPSIQSRGTLEVIAENASTGVVKAIEKIKEKFKK